MEKKDKSLPNILDKLLSGYDDETTRLRRYKNLPRQPRHQISRLHLRNNPVHLYCQCLLYPGLYLFVWIETEALLHECFQELSNKLN